MALLMQDNWICFEGILSMEAALMAQSFRYTYLPCMRGQV